MSASEPEEAPSARKAKTADALLFWQLRLLPVMAGILVTLMIVSLAASLYYYSSLVHTLEPDRTKIAESVGPMLEKGASPAEVAYRVSVMFEEATLRGQYQAWYALMMVRTWTRFMVLLLAICVSTSGCAFILGKIDATVDGSGASGAFKAGIKTNSPGLVLVLAGVLLAWMATSYPVKLEAQQRAYLASYALPSADKPPSAPAHGAANGDALAAQQRAQKEVDALLQGPKPETKH